MKRIITALVIMVAARAAAVDMWFDVDAAITEAPVNIMPLIDDTDFKTIEAAVAYDAAGMALYWHFVTTAGAYSVTQVTPTTGGVYDWTDQGDAGVYTIEIPASGGASINNDTEGYGWFTGVCTGVLPWRGPTIGFRDGNLNNALIDGATTVDAVPANTTYVAGTAQTGNDNGADINEILLDTAAMDTANELRTLLTGGTSALSTLTAANIDAEIKSMLGLATGTVSGAGSNYIYTTDIDPAYPLTGSWAGGTIIVFNVDTNGAIVRKIVSQTYSAPTYAFTVTPNFPATPSVGNTFIVFPFEASTWQTGDSYARIGANGASLSAVPWNAAWDAEVESEVDDALGAGGADLTALPWNASWDAEVQSEVNDALVALNLDHLLKTAVANNADMTTEITDGSIISNIITKGSDTSDFSVASDSLEAIRDRGDVAWTSGAATSLSTTVDTGDTSTSFTLAAGTAVNDAYNDMQITVTDGDGNGSIETRRISDWTSGLVVTVDTAFSFTPAAGDVVVIERAYLGVSVSGGDATSANQTTIINAIAALTGLSTDIATSDTAFSFTLTGGPTVNDAFNNMLITIVDADDSNVETRCIIDYSSGRVVTVDQAFSFTPAVDDVVYIERAYFIPSLWF